MTEQDDARIQDLHDWMVRWEEGGCPFGRVLNARLKGGICVGAALVAVILFPWLAWLTMRSEPRPSAPRPSAQPLDPATSITANP